MLKGVAVDISTKNVQNLVVNGDFNSSEGWTTGTVQTIVDGELVITRLAGPWRQSINASIGDMVYFGGYAIVCHQTSGFGTPSAALEHRSNWLWYQIRPKIQRGFLVYTQSRERNFV